MKYYLLIIALVFANAAYSQQYPQYSYKECVDHVLPPLVREAEKEIQQQQFVDDWQAPEVPIGMTLLFWRIRMDSALGNWHLYNAEDAKFLKETADRIKHGQYRHTKIEWATIEGRLPR